MVSVFFTANNTRVFVNKMHYARRKALRIVQKENYKIKTNRKSECKTTTKLLILDEGHREKGCVKRTLYVGDLYEESEKKTPSIPAEEIT